jgi:hypothetical protein
MYNTHASQVSTPRSARGLKITTFTLLRYEPAHLAIVLVIRNRGVKHVIYFKDTFHQDKSLDDCMMLAFFLVWRFQEPQMLWVFGDWEPLYTLKLNDFRLR